MVIEDDDDRAFMEDLFLQYKKLMYKEINNIVKDPWNAEDVMQSALIKLIDKISLLRSQGRDQRVNYIITTCKNTALNYVRDNARPNDSPYEDYLDVSDFANDGHAIEMRLMKKEELERLARAWPKLDARSRHLLEGYYILEKPMAELGAEWGMKPASVRMALTRAREKAYKLLEKEMEIKT
ncbi:RNA polymerase sigma factor [Intestinimonas butyriciproducens]|uniref:RNA polymerase sigma factor n=1 Tax=Intestinimonas butyriciproducens TaxID=1297617 RepID=UPI00242BA017|nr:sigma-70 family RNA polymerase sigma factor [Intestinimonas butyriciproducens]